MIIFTGIKTVNKKSYLCFTNATGWVEVPIDAATADRISKHLSRISPPAHAEPSADADDEQDVTTST